MRSTGTAGTNSRAENSNAEKLQALDSKHLYRAVGDNTYLPRDIAPDVWQLAWPLACEILVADLARPSHDPKYNGTRRSLLAGYLSWLAADDPDLLTVELALSETEILRYLATAAKQRRSSHRSQVALRSSLRSFRNAFPGLFTPTRVMGVGEKQLPPTEDWQYDIAYEVCAGFRNALTRQHTRTLLVACRSAGLDTSDLRWLTGKHIERRPGAGLWVVIEKPKSRRDVPVLNRFANILEDLAGDRGDRCVVSNVPAPCEPDTGSVVASLINRQLGRAEHSFTVAPGRLRRAWLAEHLGANAPLNTLLRAAGLKSLRSMESLVDKHAPAAPELDRFTAYELGGVIPKRKRKAEEDDTDYDYDETPYDDELDDA